MEVKNVFLVEDDEMFALAFKRKLENLGNYKVHHFPSSERALGLLTAIKPEIIFLDHELGGVNGVDAMPVFKEFSPKSEIVVVSGQTEVDVIQKALDNGAAKYFRKDALLIDNTEGFMREYLDKPSEYGSFWTAFFLNYKLKLETKN